MKEYRTCLFSAMCAWVLFANLQANLSRIPHYVTQRDVERNNCSLEQVQYRHFPRPYVYTRGCGYARLTLGGGGGGVGVRDKLFSTPLKIWLRNMAKHVFKFFILRVTPPAPCTVSLKFYNTRIYTCICMYTTSMTPYSSKDKLGD